MEWFSSWFDSKYYHILYQHRDDSEAHFFINNLIKKYKPTTENTMLDLACGKGRHSIYLANKGYDVTGVDLSEQSIRHATQFEQENLHFYTHDMRRSFRSNYYDYIFNFFTSFGYFSKELDHYLTLQAMKNGLKSDGLLVMDFMNAEKAKKNLVKKETKELNDITFNIQRKVENGTIVKSIEFKDEEKEYYFEERVRAFNLSEMARMFRKSGLDIQDIYGGYDLSRFDVADSNRMIIIAKKK
jgi:cyclopropane fatty-acyl-phospholipid synthase-like methyltransferase